MESSQFFLQKNSNKSVEENHVESSIIMKETFRKNAGLFIKLGQLMASVKKTNFFWMKKNSSI